MDSSSGIDLDAPTSSAIDPGAPLPGEPGAPTTPAAAPAGQGRADQPAPPQVTPEVKPQPDPDQVIELSRSVREHARKSAEATGKVAALEARVKQVEPVMQLLQLADKDPLAFITEMADVVGLTPERVLQVMATKGAGGDTALSAEDRVSVLEKQLAELRAPKPEPKPAATATAETAQKHQEYVGGLRAIMEASPTEFSLCSDEPNAPNIAIMTMASHWEKYGKDADGGTKPDYQPLGLKQALERVEKVLRAETQRRAERIGLKSPAAAAPAAAPRAGGLSNEAMGAIAPASDRILTDDEIKQEVLRQLGGR